MEGLQGAGAVVTGAGHGIGRSVALALARAGADVVVHYNRSADEAQQTVQEIIDEGGRAVAIGANATVESDVADLMAEASTFLKQGIDVLVANAGHLVQRAQIEAMSTDLWRQIIDVNLTSTFLTCRAALPSLIRSGAGRIVTMSSLAAHNGGGDGAVAYATAKAGVIGFTKGLAKEVAAKGVRVNAVAPGFIGGTAFHDTFTPEETRRAVVSCIPLGREGTPNDVAQAVLYLASTQSDFLTGETIEINGGAWFR